MRFRVHALTEALKAKNVLGIEELSPGVRSLQIRFSRDISLSALVATLNQVELGLPAVETMTVPSRVIRLPLAFDCSTTKQAIETYRKTVKDEAPWLPSNVEFMRRINGLDTVENVSVTIFQARYLVLGLGDVYLGAPCAVPLDPRTRLVTTKYNPARTWTAEGEVGIGGVYMCIYGMESPGGWLLVYMFLFCAFARPISIPTLTWPCNHVRISTCRTNCACVVNTSQNVVFLQALAVGFL